LVWFFFSGREEGGDRFTKGKRKEEKAGGGISPQTITHPVNQRDWKISKEKKNPGGGREKKRGRHLNFPPTRVTTSTITKIPKTRKKRIQETNPRYNIQVTASRRNANQLELRTVIKNLPIIFCFRLLQGPSIHLHTHTHIYIHTHFWEGEGNKTTKKNSAACDALKPD
jgi:hypothetical protein